MVEKTQAHMFTLSELFCMIYLREQENKAIGRDTSTGDMSSRIHASGMSAALYTVRRQFQTGTGFISDTSEHRAEIRAYAAQSYAQDKPGDFCYDQSYHDGWNQGIDDALALFDTGMNADT